MSVWAHFCQHCALTVTALHDEGASRGSLCMACPPLTFYSVMHCCDKPMSSQVQVKEADGSFAAKMVRGKQVDCMW